MKASRFWTIVVMAYLLFGVAACGQMGPLTLPDTAANADEDESDEGDE